MMTRNKKVIAFLPMFTNTMVIFVTCIILSWDPERVQQ